MEGVKILYRYYDTMDGCGYHVNIQKYAVIKETPCGYWYVDYSTLSFPQELIEKEKRWVSKDTRRRHCYPSLKEAWNSYKIRKSKQLVHIKHTLDRIQAINDKIVDMEPPSNSIECGKTKLFSSFIFD